MLKKATKGQTTNDYWSQFSAGRITAAVSKVGCTTNSNMPSLSLIKKVVMGINLEILPYPGY